MDARGNSYAFGPLAPPKSERDSGWGIRPVTHWDFTEGRTPA